MLYKSLVSFLSLFLKDPEALHRLAINFLKVGGVWPFAPILKLFFRVEDSSLTQTVFGIEFKNPVGLAAGLDKDGTAISGLETLGFGFMEIGTVTRHPQPGNPRQRIFRFPKQQAVINRMGFNNRGADALKKRLAGRRRTVPIGISFGKSRITPLEEAKDDHLYSFSELYYFGDYFVINVSSPNTPGVRELQDKKFLVETMSALNEYRKTRKEHKPLLLKIAPDLSNDAIGEILDVCTEFNIDGIIAVNTTVGRDGVMRETNEVGGLSGKPLAKRATEVIHYIHLKKPILPIIGVGGIFTAEDAYEKIKAGASLVQVYTGFIYEGPAIVKNINEGLIELLKKDSYKNISEAVGRG